MSRDFVRGDKELIAKLQSLKATDAKASIRKGTRAGIKVIAARARELAPERTGELKASMKVRSMPRRRNAVGTQIQQQIRYGSFVELGSKKMVGKHYLEQAAKDEKSAAAEMAVQIMKAEIEARMKL